MLWGRQKELTLIKDLLGERIPPTHFSRIYLFYGENGSGKSSMLEEVYSYLRGLKKAAVVFNLNKWAAVSENRDDDYLVGAMEVFNFNKLQRLEDESWDSYWARFLKESKERSPLVVFIIDRYDRLPSQKKIFLKEKVIDPMRIYITSYDMRFVLSGATEMPPSDQETFWGGYTIQPFKLGALSVEGVKQWLEKEKESESVLEELYEQTAGNPSKIQDFLAKRREKRQLLIAEELETGLLAPYDHNQRQIIALASLVDGFSEGIADYFLGEGKGKPAMEWICEQKELGGVKGSEGYTLPSELSAKVAIWYALRSPVEYGRTMSHIKAMRTVSKGLGGSRERRLLGYLSFLNYFTPQLVRDLYGAEAGFATSFINNNHDAFEQEDGLWKIKEDYKQAAQVAGELIPKDARSKFFEAVEESWKKRRDEILKQIEVSQKEINRFKEELENVSKGLVDLEPRIRVMSKKVEMMINPLMAKGAAPKDVQDTWNTAGVLLVLLGIIWLYVSVLASHQVSIIHCIVGGALILVGLSAPKVGKAQAALVAEGPTRRPTISLAAQGAQKNLQYLKMRFAALEQKKRALVGKMGDNKRKIVIWEAQLERPYC